MSRWRGYTQHSLFPSEKPPRDEETHTCGEGRPIDYLPPGNANTCSRVPLEELTSTRGATIAPILKEQDVPQKGEGARPLSCSQ